MASVALASLPDATFADAEGEFEQARKLNPTWTLNNAWLGNAKFRGGQLDAAETHLNETLRLSQKAEQDGEASRMGQEETEARKLCHAVLKQIEEKKKSWW